MSALSAADPSGAAIRRRKMIERQLLPRGVRDPQVLEAMGEIPREIFVEEALGGQAYADNALPIGLGQTISQPFIVARMTELLAPERAHRVLEIGTGTGYQTALLARLSGRIFSVERLGPLAEKAAVNLRRLGFDNVEIKVGDGSLGWPERAPFDRILVAAASPAIPEALAAQLAPGGRLVIPVGGPRSQILIVLDRREGGWAETRDAACLFVPLIGEEGFAPAPE